MVDPPHLVAVLPQAMRVRELLTDGDSAASTQALAQKLAVAVEPDVVAGDAVRAVGPCKPTAHVPRPRRREP